MTNGEKIKEIFPNAEINYGLRGVVVVTFIHKTIFDLDWWNAEYQEPTTENCIACKYDEIEESDGEHCKKCLAGDSQFELDKEFVWTATKNDLGIDNQNIRLIDADALIKRLRPKHFDWWGEGEQDDFSKGNNSMLEEVIEAIEEFTPVTQIRPKGHWIEEKSIHGWDGHSYQCSVCGRSIHLDTAVEDLIDYPYCHCGSRNMR